LKLLLFSVQILPDFSINVRCARRNNLEERGHRYEIRRDRKLYVCLQGEKTDGGRGSGARHGGDGRQTNGNNLQMEAFVDLDGLHQTALKNHPSAKVSFFQSLEFLLRRLPSLYLRLLQGQSKLVLRRVIQ
jgi:hypothetical protein